VIKDKLIDYL
jgi:hypothetical protein